MDDYRQMAVFAVVARRGSMTAAARELGMSTSAVSQQIRALERCSGVTLLHRSTRKLTLTDAGARFAEHCTGMVAAAEQAQQQLAIARDAPSGELRMSSPTGFARHVAKGLAPLLADYPALRMRLEVDDTMIDLVSTRIDLAFRAGRLADSRSAARRLCNLPWVLCASPGYLRRRGVPASPAELVGHQWLASSSDSGRIHLQLTGAAGEREALQLEARIVTSNHLGLEQLCLADLGLAMMAHADVHAMLREGQLVHVLPEWRLPDIPVWAVTPQRDTQPAHVRHAIEAMRIYFASAPGTTDVAP